MRRRVVLALFCALAALGTAAYLAGAWAHTFPGSNDGDRAAWVPVRVFRGASIASFPLNQSVPGAVSEVADPAGSGESVFKLTVGDGDVFPLTPTVNPRAELLSPDLIHPGQEFWWSAKFLLPRSFPASVSHWFTVLQGPFGEPFSGTPAWHIEVNHNHIQWGRNQTYDWDVPWRMPLVRGRWVEVLLHCGFSRHGFIEMWVDDRPITFFAGGTYNPSRHRATRRLRMQTRDSSNDGAPNHVAILSYRKAGMFHSATIYQGQTALGPSRSSVAFPASGG